VADASNAVHPRFARRGAGTRLTTSCLCHAVERMIQTSFATSVIVAIRAPESPERGRGGQISGQVRLSTSL